MTDTPIPAATATVVSGSSTHLTTEVAIDLHGFHPDEITGWPLESLIKQAWEMGVDRIRLVHGHGRKGDDDWTQTAVAVDMLMDGDVENMREAIAQMRLPLSS